MAKRKKPAEGEQHPVNPPFETDQQAQAAALDGTEEAPKQVARDVVQPPFDNDYEAMQAATNGQKDRRAAKPTTEDVELPPFETDAQAQAAAVNPKNKRHQVPNPTFPGRDWGAPAVNDVTAYQKAVFPDSVAAKKVAPNTDIPESKDTLKVERPRHDSSKSS